MHCVLSDWRGHTEPQSKISAMENGMKQTAEEIRAKIKRDQERMKRQECHGEVWRPTITEEEKEERKKQVESGILPF